MNMHYHVADLIVNVTAFMPGGITDWPNHIQDRIYKTLEEHSKQKGRHYIIYKAWCDVDIDTGPYVRIIARAPMKVIMQ